MVSLKAADQRIMSHLAIAITIGVVIMLIIAVAWFGWDELIEVRVALWTAYCFIFTIGWRIRFKLRSVFAQSALAVLFFASLYLVFEFGFLLLHKSGLAVNMPGLQRRLTLLPEIPEIPLPYEIAALILAVLLARHHYKEWKISRRQSEVPGVVEELLVEFEKFSTDPNKAQGPIKAAFWETVFEKFKSLLDKKSKRNIALSLMEKSADGLLAVTFVYPTGAPVDATFKVAVGKGGAGKAYAQKIPIYVPSIRHLVGINGKTLKSVGVTYELSEDKKNFRSLLSVPVILRGNVKAVLNVESRKRSVFNPEDFEIVALAAGFVALSS